MTPQDRSGSSTKSLITRASFLPLCPDLSPGSTKTWALLSEHLKPRVLLHHDLFCRYLRIATPFLLALLSLIFLCFSYTMAPLLWTYHHQIPLFCTLSPLSMMSTREHSPFFRFGLANCGGHSVMAIRKPGLQRRFRKVLQQHKPSSLKWVRLENTKSFIISRPLLSLLSPTHVFT